MPQPARRPHRRGWLLARGLWWRRGLSAAVLAVATLTMGAAALGPLYARAAGESTLRDELTQAGSATGLHFQDIPYGFEYATAVSSFDRAEAKAPTPGSLRGYPTRITSIYVVTGAHAPGVSGVGTGLLWRSGVCAHVVVVTGHCPTGLGQALVSQRTLDGNYGWKLGTRLSVAIGATLTVVGSYTPRDPAEPYWFGQNYFDAAAGNNGPDTVDSVLVDRAEFDAVPPATQGVLSWDYPLDPAAIRLDDVPRLRRDVAALGNAYSKASECDRECPGQPINLLMSTSVGQVLDGAAHQRNLVDTGTLLVTLQLSLLAWLVLFHVVSDAVESRGNEIALAKLRGLRPWWTVRFALGEPLLLLAIAMPLGLGLAWVAGHLFSAAVLVPHTPVVLTWYSAASLAGGLAGGIVAAAAGSYRALTRTVLAQWRRTAARGRSSRSGLLVDVLVSLGAVAGLLLLRATHQAGTGNDNAALLAPGLLVIAVALLGTRLLPVLIRLLLRPTRASGRIGLFLAARQVVRRPAGLRLAALLAVAVGLATFAVSGEAVAAANRGARARAEVGADRVVTMQYVRGVDPVAAVSKADPDGRWAMAAASWLPDGGNSVVGTVLAVDAPRMARIGYAAAGGPSAGQIAATIARSTVPEIITTAAKMRVEITAAAIRGVAPQVQFMFRTPGNPFASTPAGTLRPGTHTYTANLDCAAGCSLLGLVWNRPLNFAGPMSGTLLVHRIEQYDDSRWAAVDAALSHAGAWRGGPEFSYSSDMLEPTPDGLRDDYHSTDGGYGGISYAFAPQPLPTVATYAAVITGGQTPNPPQMVDAFGATATFTVEQSTAVLPLVLANGLIANLSFLRAQLPAFDSEANWMIWLGPRAPADALNRLRAAGLTLQGTQSTQSRVVELGRQGPALSLFLLLGCAIIGSIVAVGGTAIAISASARRRSFETAALRVLGVPRRSLYRAGVLEQLMLLGAAVALGVPAGALAARLAMPVIPEFADHTAILLRYQPPVLPILGFAAGFVALVCLTAMIAARAVLHAASPERLREAEE